MTDWKQVFLFNLSGAIGTVLFYFLYEFILHALVPNFFGSMKASFAWTISYIVSIIWQHALHRYIVFGTKTSYLKSLIGTYASYFVSIIFSHFFMMFLEWCSVGSRMAWMINIGLTGILNYFLVKKAF